MFSVKQDHHGIRKTVYLVHIITIEGKKEVLGIGIGIGESESSTFRMTFWQILKKRGVKDILIASVDGLKGFENAIESIFPYAGIRQCIIHQIRA